MKCCKKLPSSEMPPCADAKYMNTKIGGYSVPPPSPPPNSGCPYGSGPAGLGPRERPPCSYGSKFLVLKYHDITIMETCANPGCDQPGTNKCSACKTTFYCGPICQTADWAHHKEECPGHLRKVGMAHLEKALGFEQQCNWPQTLRHAEIAATKLKQMKDRIVEAIDEALSFKYNALNFMARDKEALECAKEWYCLYLTEHTHPPAIRASFSLIESCVHNKEFFDAALYARTLWETITLSRDSHISDDEREQLTARGAMELARALWQLAVHGGMPPEERQETGKEEIMLARRALEINTQLHGTEIVNVADSRGLLADILYYFNDDDDDDEALCLHEQAKTVYARVQGSLSSNVAICEYNLGVTYFKRAKRAHAAHDLDRCVPNLELALSHFREATRIYRAINRMDMANDAARQVVVMEELLRQTAAERVPIVSRG